MRLKRLTIQAFGPFAGREVIDFSRLGRHPLFLINGPTGAGKSSVLDAICFALYGQTTGAEREPAQMRCDHSNVSVLTEVSLEFTLGDKCWLIRRVPEQERSKNRGQGTTRQLPEAQLWQTGITKEKVEKSTAGNIGASTEKSGNPGRLIISRSVTEATAKIKQLMGLGVEQFRQVMVLPQGKFRELLMAESKERESIFSQLFETQIFKKIENRLKEKSAAIRQAVDKHQNEIQGILRGADVNSEAELEQEVEELKPKFAQAKSDRNHAKDQLKAIQRNKDQAVTTLARYDDLLKKEKALTASNAQSGEYESKQMALVQAQNVQAIYHRYVRQKSEAEKLVSAQQQHSDAKQALMLAIVAHSHALEQVAQARLAAEKIDPLKLRQIELQRLENLNAELASAIEKLSMQANNAASSKRLLEEKKRTFGLLADELVSKEALAMKHGRDLEQLPAQQLLLENLAARLTERQQLAQTEKEIEAKAIQKETANVTIAARIHDFEAAEIQTRKTELAWHSGQAAVLAESLEDHQPCPVCGSKEHPAPAKLASGSPLVSKQQVDTARQMESKARDAMQASKDGLSDIDRRLDVLANQQKTLKERLQQFADKTINSINQEKRACQSLCQVLLAIKAEKQAHDERIAEIKKIQLDLQGVLSSLEVRATEDHAEVIKAQDRVERLEALIPKEYRDPGALQEALAEVVANIRALVEKQSLAESSLKAKQSNLDQSTAQEKALSDQLDCQQSHRAAAAIEWQTALENSEFEDFAQCLNARLEETEQATLREEIDRYRTEINSLQAVVNQLQLELEGKQKPDLLAIDLLLKEKSDRFKMLDNAWREYEARSKYLTGVQEKLQQAHAIDSELASQYAVVGTLSEVACGATGNKISLQRFVLSVLLDDVLIQASRRLRMMSSGRYRLLRKVDRTKGNKASGLELEVEDGHTGKSRSVATLSGGESFMAALSLALGLSDVVQSYAGGIKLDTLFIDEGFGSLDAESLDAAINVLTDLQASGRTIGIISHVSELKEQMALRIDVHGGRTGSRISTTSSVARLTL